MVVVVIVVVVVVVVVVVGDYLIIELRIRMAKGRWCKALRQKFLRVVNDWNRLPPDVAEVPMIKTKLSFPTHDS